MKKIAFLLLASLSPLIGKIFLPPSYGEIVEKLLYFKEDRFKVFYGSPVEEGTKVCWLMPALFEGEDHRVRAVYEISFINCHPHKKSAQEADIIYLTVSDIDLKFKNRLSAAYRLFAGFTCHADPNKKYILIRKVDVSNIYYPEIFIADIYSDFRKIDQERILRFIRLTFQNEKKPFFLSEDQGEKSLCKRDRIVEDLFEKIEEKKICTEIEGKNRYFHISHCYLKDDPWKSYYVVTTLDQPVEATLPFLLRIDSGCASGQIYGDPLCDCLDQLHQGLLHLSHVKNGLLIHIPGHDGRGFGVAPKAETEIYKRGGEGRVHTTEALDTIQAAYLLYKTENFDIRTYEGCAKILENYKIRAVHLLTDNKRKIKALEERGISVNRRQTHTEKVSCLTHIKAKKSSKNYFSD